MFEIITSKFCQNCLTLKELLKTKGIPYTETEFKSLGPEEDAELLTDLRCSGYSEKINYVEVDGRMRPNLVMPIIRHRGGATSSDMIFDHGQIRVEFLRGLEEVTNGK